MQLFRKVVSSCLTGAAYNTIRELCAAPLEGLHLGILQELCSTLAAPKMA